MILCILDLTVIETKNYNKIISYLHNVISQVPECHQDSVYQAPTLEPWE